MEDIIWKGISPMNGFRVSHSVFYKVLNAFNDGAFKENI